MKFDDPHKILYSPTGQVEVANAVVQEGCVPPLVKPLLSLLIRCEIEVVSCDRLTGCRKPTRRSVPHTADEINRI